MDTWIISEPVKRDVIQTFELALKNESTSKLPLEINAIMSYSFTRSQPSFAVAPEGSQKFTLFNSTHLEEETVK